MTRFALALLCIFCTEAHAQQGSWNIPRSAFSTERTPDPVVKVCTEPQIRTMEHARAADAKRRLCE